jgi:hypothetical protein
MEAVWWWRTDCNFSVLELGRVQNRGFALVCEPVKVPFHALEKRTTTEVSMVSMGSMPLAVEVQELSPRTMFSLVVVVVIVIIIVVVVTIIVVIVSDSPREFLLKFGTGLGAFFGAICLDVILAVVHGLHQKLRDRLHQIVKKFNKLLDFFFQMIYFRGVAVIVVVVALDYNYHILVRCIHVDHFRGARAGVGDQLHLAVRPYNLGAVRTFSDGKTIALRLFDFPFAKRAAHLDTGLAGITVALQRAFRAGGGYASRRSY